MNWQTKWRFGSVFIAAALVAVGAIALTTPAQAVEPRPVPGKAKTLKFPDFKEFKLDNGLEALVVEHNEQPVVSFYMVFRTGATSDPDGKESLASFTFDQLNKGTKTRSALELAEWIESVGGSASAFTNSDFSGVSVTVLSEYKDVAYGYLQDIARNPTFPQEELDLLAKQTKTGLEFERSQPAAVAMRQLTYLLYGDHPYSKQATVESVEAITRDDVVKFYETNLVPNNVLMLVVGDVSWKDVRKSLKNMFGDWQPGTPHEVMYAGAPEAGPTKVYIYNKSGAPQTEIFVGQLAPTATNPDWPALTVGNRILGGGSQGRLFKDLRETKGYTYTARSSFTRAKDIGRFVARTPVRTEATDSALVDLMSHIERIATEPVSQEELDKAKSYLIGNFPLTIETPDQIAGQVANYRLLGLDQKDLETYRDRLSAVEVEDVSRVMGKYLHPDRVYVVLVGDAQVLADKVSVVGEVELYDLAGEPFSLDLVAVEPVDYQYDTSRIKSHGMTYSVTAQSMNLGDMNVNVKKNDDVIEVSSSLKGMISMSENFSFSATDFAPISYNSSMQMGPQKMGSEYAFTATKGSGSVTGPESPEPKDVAFDLVPGTIIDGAVEYALTCLPMEAGKTYRFPVVDSQSGSLQNIDVEILEVADIETKAGTFSAFKVKVKRADGELYLYIDTVAPHLMVKQEVPSQGLVIELTSIAD